MLSKSSLSGFALSSISVFFALTIIGKPALAETSSIDQFDISKGVIKKLADDTLTAEELTAYFQKNRELLRNNIEQGLNRYQKQTVGEAVTMNFDKYIQNKDRIITNMNNFNKATKRVAEKIRIEYGNDIPPVVLVPCVGLMANGGWADTVNGTRYIFAALEMIPPQVDIGALLAHEITHGISEVGWDIVLDGIYNEGYATYVSYELCPGMPESVYFMMRPDKLAECYKWMDTNRERILSDMDKPLAVLNDMHKFYLTTGYSDYPNIGYVIGFEYIKHIRNTHTLEELRTFAMDVDTNKACFEDFIRNATFGPYQSGPTAN